MTLYVYTDDQVHVTDTLCNCTVGNEAYIPTYSRRGECLSSIVRQKMKESGIKKQSQSLQTKNYREKLGARSKPPIRDVVNLTNFC